MLVQLIIATAMVIVTVLIHLFGLALLMRLLRSHSRIFRKLTIMPLTLLLAATAWNHRDPHPRDLGLRVSCTCSSDAFSRFRAGPAPLDRHLRDDRLRRRRNAASMAHSGVPSRVQWE